MSLVTTESNKRFENDKLSVSLGDNGAGLYVLSVRTKSERFGWKSKGIETYTNFDNALFDYYKNIFKRTK